MGPSTARDDLGQGDLLGRPGQHVAAAHAPLGADQAGALQGQEDLLEVGLGQPGPLGDVADRGRALPVGVEGQREQGPAGVVTSGRDLHGPMLLPGRPTGTMAPGATETSGPGAVRCGSGQRPPSLPAGQVLGHGPSEGHQAAAGAPTSTSRRRRRPPRSGRHLGAHEVEAPGLAAVAGHHEGPVVDAPVGAEALGQTPAPGPLLAGGLVVRARAPRRSGRRRPGSPRRPAAGSPPGRPRPGRPAGPGGTCRPSWPAARCRPGTVRSTVASPISSEGVPPMRSSVEKE